jgi:hypothetical protein
MITYKDFLANKKQSIQEQTEEVVSCEPEILELEELPNLLGEAVKENHGETMDPPAILIMRRKSVRQYPNNQRVALYYVDKINKYVTVPYTAMQWSSSGVAEEMDNNIVLTLQSIVESGKSQNFIFNNGDNINLNVNIAETTLKLYNSISNENRIKLTEMANESKQGFYKVLDFAKKNLK